MSDYARFRLIDSLALPDAPQLLSTPLEAIWQRVAIRHVQRTTTAPTQEPTGFEEPDAITEEEYFAGLGPYEGEVPPFPDEELIDPPAPATTEPYVPFTSTLAYDLFAIDEIVVDLAGFWGLRFVLRPGPFTAEQIIRGTATTTTFTVAVAVRFGPELLRPARRVPNSSPARYEPDPERRAVDLELGEVMVTISPNGAIDFAAQVSATLSAPAFIGSSRAVIEPNATVSLDLGEQRTLLVSWTEQNLNSLLGSYVPNLGDRGQSAPAAITLRAILAGPNPELRLDWSFEASAPARRFSLPGLTVSIPARAGTLLLVGGDANPEVSLLAHLNAGDAVTAASTFAWGRDDERELQNDQQRPPEQPLFSAALTPNAAVSLVLCSFPLAGGKAPTFLRQLETPLPLLTPPAAANAPTPRTSVKLNPANWTASLSLNLSDDTFTLPFLRGAEQYVQVKPPAANTPIAINLATTEAEVPLEIEVRVGDLRFNTSVKLVFNLERFGLRITHDEGIALYGPATIGPQNYLGLTWQFKGAPTAEGFHYFTIVTRNYHYAIQQAEGAEFSVTYDKISQEPIGFRVRDFAISPSGLNLRAEVLGDPARLLGIDTKFRFSLSGFEIKDSRIQDFTLLGSGPMPPDLVGEATVDIALQFTQGGNGLKLSQGSAILKGNKLLSCKGTRFEFQVDALGLKFHDDGRFHLYFTITGKAQFRLAANDEREGLLSYLPNITIDMVDCPLAGDTRVLAQHVRFLIELPRPLNFNLLGCFEMELRGFGFVPQASQFGGDGAMWLSGQIKFAAAPGDVKRPEIDYHSLFIGLPERGRLIPRVHLEQIVVDVSVDGAFRLYAVVKFVNTDTMKGFEGEGELAITGLPILRAAFGFMRVRRASDNAWVRAWFIYGEAGGLNLVIPIVQIYIREIGLGLGYRYTIAMIRAADETGNPKELVKKLDELSRTQGDLARREAWVTDIEQRGGPRWTFVLRALISQNAAGTPAAEVNLPCLFLFDAILAIRTDLTFLMSARGWIHTNYADWLAEPVKIRQKPYATAYMLLAPAQRRFLARIVTNPGGYIGDHPPLPPLVKQVIGGLRYSATLLVEPGLFHLELGWPNKLGWTGKLGPISVSITSGFIFRLSREEIVMGMSYEARGSIAIEGGVSLGFVGVNVRVAASVAYGMRLIGAVSFVDPADKSLFYGAVGLEIRCAIRVEFWINAIFKKFRATFSVDMLFTAGVEIGMDGIAVPGLRGQGTVAVRVCGRGFRFSIKLGVNEEAVEAAFQRTQEYLQLGLGASDAEGPPDPVPGTVAATRGQSFALRAMVLGAALEARVVRPDAGNRPALAAPHYTAYAVRADAEPVRAARALEAQADDAWNYILLFPRGDLPAGAAAEQFGWPDQGFFPPPPANDTAVSADFRLELPAAPAGFVIEQFFPQGNEQTGWHGITPGGEAHTWRVDWAANVVDEASVAQTRTDSSAAAQAESRTLRALLAGAFVNDGGTLSDPNPLGTETADLEDERVQNPAESDFEAAVRGAFEQFAGSPFFRHDPQLAYDSALDAAFSPQTTIYSADGKLTSAQQAAADRQQGADQFRGVIIDEMMGDLRSYAAGSDPDQRAGLETRSPAFQLGVVFRYRGPAPDWLNLGEGADANLARPQIAQRATPADVAPPAFPAADPPPALPPRKIWLFNVPRADFRRYAPTFDRVRHYTNASTIAITWDLRWEEPPPGCVGSQADPEEHLLHYRVTRRAIDSDERDETYTVKSAQVLHRPTDVGAGELLQRLRPRFQVVDHFTRETPEEVALLPATGRSYLYTIVPIDVAGNPGRPLSLVATRYPSVPPAVAADALLTVDYLVEPAHLLPPDTVTTEPPPLLIPRGLSVEWSEPLLERGALLAPAARHRLIFRRSATLPIGSYGRDSVTQRDKADLDPTAMQRPLPTDIRIDLPDPLVEGGLRISALSLADLRTAGVFPAEGEPWRPESWQVYIQAFSIGEVPSSLAPVQVALRVATSADPTRAEERRPGELEWLPVALRLPLTTPEDERATTGLAYVPMPASGARFSGTVLDVGYSVHPERIRGVRMRWNQGPSALPRYPLDLSAAYNLYELDIDAHTDATFTDAERLGAALRPIQDVRMAPADDLPLLPGDTLATSRWEAWYPSTIQRLDARRATPSETSENPYGAWYSWREAGLAWPEWGTIGSDRRQGLSHPLLRRLISRLNGVLIERVSGVPAATLDAGTLPLPPALLAAINNLEPVGATRRQLDPNNVTVRTVRPGKEWVLRRYGKEPAPPGETEQLRAFFTRGEERVVGLEYRLKLVADATVEVRIDSPYLIDQQSAPFLALTTLDAFFTATPPAADPYGWGVLQQFGLSIGFSLRDARRGGAIPGVETARAVHAVLSELLQIAPFTTLAAHLHAELLFQPGRAIEIVTPQRTGPQPKIAADPNALLATIQVSLRPTVQQRLRYDALEVRGLPGRRLTAIFAPLTEPISVIVQTTPPSDAPPSDEAEAPLGGQIELDANKRSTELPLQLPTSGATTLLIRSANAPGVALALNLTQSLDAEKQAGFAALATELNLPLAYEANPTPRLRVNSLLKPIGADLDAAAQRSLRARLRTLLGADDAEALLALSVGNLAQGQLLQPLTITDERTAYFSVPNDLAQRFAAGSGPLRTHWLDFRSYLTNHPGGVDPRFRIATSKEEIAQQLPGYLAWSQRFFDHSGAVNTVDSAALMSTGAGPWLATAYPRAESPAFTTPDAGGRLTYNHLIADQWAHAYRYYIQPVGRYDHLLHALREALLEPAVVPASTAQPGDAVQPDLHLDPQAGGLDVVLDRARVVAMPLVLASARLDEAAQPGRPAPPGHTWEVIVAQHPEQALIERNQTVARRLAFRQVAFTLVRRFAYDTWLDWLEEWHAANESTPPTLRIVEHEYPDLPARLPARLDHVDPAALAVEVIDADETARSERERTLRSLDLPLRLGGFQQGATVLQWDGLPFYYEHRLHLIAQTATDDVVSKTNFVTQRDFAYQSPIPTAVTAGFAGMPQPDAAAIRAHALTITLCRLWDSLPPEAADHWPGERPDAPLPGADAPLPAGERRLSALPDPDVVYQLIEVFNGNVEVQAEFSFGVAAEPEPDAPEPAPGYQRRQLGRRLISADPTLHGPDDAGNDYRLELSVYPIGDVPLSTSYDLAAAGALAGKARMEGTLLRFDGVPSAADRDALLAVIGNPADQEAVRSFYAAWERSEAVPGNEPLSPLPDAIQTELNAMFADGRAAFVPPTNLELVWSGLLSPADNAALRSDSMRADDAFNAAIERLIAAATAAPAELVTVESLHLPAHRAPAPPPGLAWLPADPDVELYTAAEWRGPLWPEDVAALRALTLDLPTQTAIQRLIAAARAAQEQLTSREQAPIGIDQPPDIIAADPAFSALRFPTDADGRIYTSLAWDGPLYSAERLRVEPALRAWAQLPAFRDAVDNLFLTLDQRTIRRPLRPSRPVQSDLPQALYSQNGATRRGLWIEAQRLAWYGDPPTRAQRELLTRQAIRADEGFHTSLTALLVAIDADRRIALNLPPPPEGETPPPLVLPATLLNAVQQRLRLEPADAPAELVWTGSAPDETMLAALRSAELDPRLNDARQRLIAIMTGAIGPFTATLEPGSSRPRREQIVARITDQALRTTFTERLQLTPTELVWTGWLSDPAMLAALEWALTQSTDSEPTVPYDPAQPDRELAFTEALTALIAELTYQELPLNLPVRPTQAAAPAGLLLGRARLQFHGPPTLAEGRALWWRFAAPPVDSADPPAATVPDPARSNAGTRAIERLFAAGQQIGQGGRSMLVRARRGAAAPSPTQPIAPARLVPATPNEEHQDD